VSGGRFVISLDFELHWGVRDKRTVDQYRANLAGARAVVPRLLERFADRGIHATWATVGMLFCEGREDLAASRPERTPTYENRSLSPYGELEALGADEREDPFHFAPSLVDRIAETPHQELATHTFSHFYCLEPGQTKEQFAADLGAAVAVARRRDVTLRSIVFPRNQVNPDYLDVCAAHGLAVFRGARAESERGLPAAEERRGRRARRLAGAYLPLARGPAAAEPGAHGLCDVPADRFFRPRSRTLRLLEPLKVRRLQAELRHAGAEGSDYHLWWHPHNFGVETDAHLDQLDRVLDTFAEQRDRHGMRSVTMAEAAGGPRAR
jgi:hypothetical protein